ncbi:hypothetical protein GE09DRAFT_1126692, partial [Coniochaeta sp. 2T2.1]
KHPKHIRILLFRHQPRLPLLLRPPPLVLLLLLPRPLGELPDRPVIRARVPRPPLRSRVLAVPRVEPHPAPLLLGPAERAPRQVVHGVHAHQAPARAAYDVPAVEDLEGLAGVPGNGGPDVRVEEAAEADAAAENGSGAGAGCYPVRDVGPPVLWPGLVSGCWWRWGGGGGGRGRGRGG